MGARFTKVRFTKVQFTKFFKLIWRIKDIFKGVAGGSIVFQHNLCLMIFQRITMWLIKLIYRVSFKIK